MPNKKNPKDSRMQMAAKKKKPIGSGYDDGPISESVNTERVYPTSQQIAKMRTDAARFKPIKGTLSNVQKIQILITGQFKKTGTPSWEEGQSIKKVPKRKIDIPFLPDLVTTPGTKVTKKKK